MTQNSSYSKKYLIVGVIVIVGISLSITVGYLSAQKSYLACPNPISSSSVLGSVGFSDTINHRDADELRAGLHEFILKPDTTGYIMMKYRSVTSVFVDQDVPENIGDFTNSTKEIIVNVYHMAPSEFYNSTKGLWEIDESGKLIHLPSYTEEVGVSYYASDVVILPDDSVDVTYVVKADASAKRGTYLISIVDTCPGELVTVGERPYSGILPWNRNPNF